MKKILLLAVAAMACGVSAFAQQKGDMYVGGTIGVSTGGGSYTTTVEVAGNAQTSDAFSMNNGTDFGLAAYYGYFVIDNLAVFGGVEYAMKASGYSGDNGSSTITNLAMFQVGAAYYVNVYDNKLYYTPGISLGFGGGSYGNDTKLSIPFVFGIGLNIGTFEFQINDKFAVTANILTLTYSHTKMRTIPSAELREGYDAYMSQNAASFGLNYGLNVGMKYYF